jgi:hypothetical protein
MNVTFNNIDEYISYVNIYGHNFYNHNIIREYEVYQKIMQKLIKLKGDEWRHHMSYNTEITNLTIKLEKYGINFLT